MYIYICLYVYIYIYWLLSKKGVANSYTTITKSGRKDPKGNRQKLIKKQQQVTHEKLLTTNTNHNSFTWICVLYSHFKHEPEKRNSANTRKRVRVILPTEMEIVTELDLN